MEKKNIEIIKKSDHNINASSSKSNSAAEFSGEQNIFDTPCEDDLEKYDNFMEMLTTQNYYFPPTASIFDLLGTPQSDMQPDQPLPPLSLLDPAVGDSSEMAHTPMTPNNSSSISSSSNEAATEDQISIKIGEDGEGNKKLLKPKKKNLRMQREPRFAFLTKSDIDNLDDGYKWRKYGQKSVKNSPFSRNYYRCSNAGCGVKKRVERSFQDHSIVVTTYEGTHTHICPVNALSMEILPDTSSFPGLSSGVGGGIASNFSSTGGMSGSAYNVGGIGSGSIGSRAMEVGGIDISGTGGSGISGGVSDINMPYTIEQTAPYQQNQQQPYLYNNPSLSSYNFGAATTNSGSFSNRLLQDRRNIFTSTPDQQLDMFRDQGLLHDMVAPSQMQVEKKKDQE